MCLFSFLSPFKIFSLFLVLSSLILKCLIVVFFLFHTCEFYWISCILTIFLKFENFSIISSNFFVLFFPPPQWLITQILGHLKLFHSSLILCSFFGKFLLLCIQVLPWSDLWSTMSDLPFILSSVSGVCMSLLKFWTYRITDLIPFNGLIW